MLVAHIRMVRKREFILLAVSQDAQLKLAGTLGRGYEFIHTGKQEIGRSMAREGRLW